MLSVQNISFAYETNPVIENISFTIEKGQHVAIIGESGCGKSTLLKLIYGLYDLRQGAIFYDEKPIRGPQFNLVPGEAYIKYLAQDFDLMPYITVAENVGKFLSNSYQEEKNQRISDLLAMVEMTEFAQVKAQYLSGGQQQRVALARVLALEPELLLLDEPFSQMDNFRKNALRRNLFAYLKRKGITCIVATHDSADALSFADETIVLQNGTLMDKAPSQALYLNPKNIYVASLFGEVNAIAIPQENGESVTSLFYPHQLRVAVDGWLQVQVKDSYFKGSRYLIKSVYQKQVIFFEHHEALEKEAFVFLESTAKLL